MVVLKSFQHPLALLVLAVIIQTTWTVNMKATEDLQRDINLQNGLNLNSPASVSHIIPTLSTKQFDERLSNIIANNVLHFGHNIGLQLAARDPNASNTEIFSPLSIMSALSILMLGAKGRSYQELKQLNGLDSDSEFRNYPSIFHEELGLILSDLQHLNGINGGMKKRQNALWRNTHLKLSPSRSTNRSQAAVNHVIKVANGLFVQSGYELNPDYKQVINSIYNSEITQLDFQSQSNEARDHINSWVNKSTFGKIPQIIHGQVEKSTNVLLASVLYFKGFWVNPFFPRSTREDNFYPDGLNSPPIKVQMMPTGGIFPFYDSKEYDCRVIGLPYKGNETTMYVIQPNNSTRQRLRKLQLNLNGYKINQMIDKMERKTTVMVFPKMHFTRSMTMKDVLKNMDVQSIFESSYSDLSLIGGRPPTTNNVAAEATAQFAPSNTVVPFASIYRSPATQPMSHQMDLHEGLVFSSRIDAMDQPSTNVTITTASPDASNSQTVSQARDKRQVSNLYRDPTTEALANLESDRLRSDQYRSNLYVDDIIHKVDFAVDEYGTEAAAATLTYLTRSGTDVVFRGDSPFLIIIRHDPTKLPLFYGIINKPEL